MNYYLCLHLGLCIYIFFFMIGYPAVAPELRFETKILHCNVNSYGKLCHPIFSRSYTSDTNVRTLLDCVFGLLLSPDQTDPLDSSLTLGFYQADGTYEVHTHTHTCTHAYIHSHKHHSQFSSLFIIQITDVIVFFFFFIYT